MVSMYNSEGYKDPVVYEALTCLTSRILFMSFPPYDSAVSSGMRSTYRMSPDICICRSG